MATPKKNTAYEFYLSLVDTANPASFKANPTIAAGDFLLSTDGLAFANLATLPVVTPAGSISVKISLSAAEMNGDKIIVQGIDQAGNEWDDVLVFIDVPASNEADAVLLDSVMEGGLTFVQSMRVQNAAAAGKLSGAATTTVLIRDLADTRNRIAATVDATGNRSAITLDTS